MCSSLAVFYQGDCSLAPSPWHTRAEAYSGTFRPPRARAHQVARSGVWPLGAERPEAGPAERAPGARRSPATGPSHRSFPGAHGSSWRRPPAHLVHTCTRSRAAACGPSARSGPRRVQPSAPPARGAARRQARVTAPSPASTAARGRRPPAHLVHARTRSRAAACGPSARSGPRRVQPSAPPARGAARRQARVTAPSPASTAARGRRPPAHLVHARTRSRAAACGPSARSGPRRVQPSAPPARGAARRQARATASSPARGSSWRRPPAHLVHACTRSRAAARIRSRLREHRATRWKRSP